MPMVLASARSGAMSSPNSSRASRPTRNAAPVSGASTLSPEQSANSRARTWWKVCVVICQPVTAAMELPAISASRQVQLSSSSIPGW